MKNYLLLISLSFLLMLPKTQFAQWTTVLDDGKYYFMGIDFKNENTGFAAGYNMVSDSAVIIRTVDAGNNWEEVYRLPDGYASPYCFTFIGDSLIISGGQDGMLFKSTDGGSTWEWYAALPTLNDIYDIHFFNDQIGIAGFYRTTDGGYNWENMEIGNTNDFSPVNDSAVFTAAGGLFYSNDHGANWLKVDPGPPHSYSSVCMATDLVGYAVKYPSIINKTFDGGMTWFEIDSLPYDEIKQIRFIDENTGYILVNNSSMRVLKTLDGGNTWDYVLFGNDYCHQMASADESTILVPTINGIMYKTTNGGGEPILPRNPEIDWYSGIRYHITSTQPAASCINSFSQVYILNSFKDTLFVNESPILVFPNLQSSGVYILKYNSWGGLEWSKVIVDPEAKLYKISCAVDNSNDFYAFLYTSDPYNLYLSKFSSEGDSLWTVDLFEEDPSNAIANMKTTYDDHIVIAGRFSGTLSYGNNSIHTDNSGIFMLELDQNGNYVNLTRVVETIDPYSFGDLNFDINDEGSTCISFRCYGPVYIDSDTLNPSRYYLLNVDQNLNMLWYNTEFDTIGKEISNILYLSNSNVLIGGKDHIDNTFYPILYQYDDQGIKTDSATIKIESDLSYSPAIATICQTENNRILVSGRYKDYCILDNDTLCGFSQYGNHFIYTLSDHLEFIKSSHLSPGNITSMLENQHNSYLLNRWILEDIIFANDTIPGDKYNYSIAKLNSIITPISEKSEYNNLFVYPNPGNGIFHISFPEMSPKNGHYEIFSITGQKVFESKFSERNNTINLSNLDKGVYFIQFNLEGEIYSQKVILQ